MSKRLILAIALSFLVMMIWARLTQKFYPIEQQEVTTEIPQPVPPPVLLKEEKEEALLETISHGRELFFHPSSASFKKIIFPRPEDSRPEDYTLILEQGFSFAGQDLVFTQKELNSEEAIFVYEDDKKRITKSFNYSDPDFIITLDIEFENLSEQSLSYPSDLILGIINLNSRGLESRFKEVFLKQSDRIIRLNPSKETRIQYSGEFFGFRNRYFCAILVPVSFPEIFQIIKINKTRSQLNLSRPTINLLPNQIGHLRYRIYLGPQQAGLLKSFHNGAEDVIYYGFFDPIAKVLLNILRFFSRLVHNWGWATVILSIFIFIILFPLSLKQMRSAREMQHLQPKIEELRRAYKDNPQRLNKETLELYRKNKINPLGGCLPMILQIPIFFSLYQALMRSIELKGANFLWIKDLSQPDRLFTSPEINILPILMAITMFIQQRFSMIPSAGSSAEQQRLMSFLFPVLFGAIFYRMPSGLVLYWFINSLLMSAYQLKIRLTSEPIKH